MAHLQDKSIDELTRFIDGGSKKGKAKKKKGKEEEERPIITDAAPNRPVFPEGTRWMLPLGWMDPAEDAAAHLRCWRELGQCELTAVVEANRYLRLQLQPADKNRLLSTPGSCVLAFPRHDAVKRMSDTEMLQGSNVQFFSTLLNVFVFSNDELRDPGKEGKCPPPEVSKGNLVFELLVRQRDCLTPPPLRFSSGPCIPKSRVDMSRTVQWTEPELVQMRVDGREEPVIRMRWWINVEVLQVVCKSNLIDCTGLERTDVEPFEWLCCVYDDGFPGAPALQECNWAFRHGLKGPAVPPVLPAPAASPAAAAAAAAAPPAETKAAEEADLEELSCSSNSSRTLALPAKLVHFWCDLVGKELPYIAKADSYVHFDVRMTSTGREVIPEHWIVAFVEREKSEKSKARYHTGLLNLNIIPESSVPEGYLASAQELDPNAKGPRDYLHFELLLRESDTAQPLCITAGPVRENPSTKHRESMRIDLGRSVRQIQKDVVEKSGKRLNRNSWYVCIETLRLVATCNGLDCSGLDDAKAPPVQWVIVLCDEQLEQSAETRSIEDLLDFIDGKADDALRELKEPKPAPPDPERVKATAVALFDLMSSLGAGRPEEKADRPTAASAARAAAEAAAAAASGDPVAQVKAAAELLAQAAAQSNSPRKFAAALAAAQLAAEPYGMARRCKSRARLHWALPTAGLVLVLQLCWAPVGWAIANGAPRGRGMTAVQQSVKHRERTVVRNNWVDEFQDFRDSGYDVAKLMLKKAQEKGKGDRLLAASRTLSEGDNNAAAGALHAIRDLLGSQEGILQRELTGLRTQLSALDTRFSQVQERLQESEEREGLLGKRLTAALKQERELKFALETARQQYESVSEELEGLQDSETKLKRQVQELVQREQDLKNADVVRPKDLEEMESLRKERDQLVMRLQQLEQEGKDYGRELAESQKREVALQAALDNSTEQMAELITALTESRAREAELQGQLSAALEREQSMSIDLQESQKREQQLTKELEDQAQLLADALSSQEQLAERLDETLRKATSVAADLTASRKHEVALMKELKDSMDREEQLKNELEAVARPVS
eukprot:symbB.v1.2.019468.t1/scaffold1593.1/size164412/10